METLVLVGKVVFCFILVVGVHEVGHAIVAILCGIKVEEISIGIGPGIRIKSKTNSFPTLILSPIAIGGYTKMEEAWGETQPFWKKLMVNLGGMVANVLCAIILLIGGGFPILKAILLSFKIWLVGVPYLFWMIFAGQIHLHDLSGPIGIGQMVAGNTIPYWKMLVMVNFSLAIFNFIPLPPLDGGHIMTDILEWLFGKTKTEKFNNILQAIGNFCLLFLLIFVIIQDISSLFHH
ncbi:MAG: site-2 protease family protein [Parcubacteria group bacterium]|nr:site-2 protease family protein [Parcubacteria group bacterium]